jgi:hypothetical protein
MNVLLSHLHAAGAVMANDYIPRGDAEFNG